MKSRLKNVEALGPFLASTIAPSACTFQPWSPVPQASTLALSMIWLPFTAVGGGGADGAGLGRALDGGGGWAGLTSIVVEGLPSVPLPDTGWPGWAGRDMNSTPGV